MSVLRDYAAAITAPTLPGGLVAPPDRFDEVVDGDGALRPAWKGLADVAVSLTEDDLVRISGDVTRMLSDDGVTYVRPGRGPGAWRLDPIPLVLEAAAWQGIAAGLTQRAELLNALLVDFYGAGRLLAEGIIPAAAVLAHPGYARVVARSSAVDEQPLVLSATDLGRDPDGEWRVLADRTQAPSGLGYAMENRRVVARALPDLYAEAAQHRLEPYLGALRAALLQSAPDTAADPRVVVLSPGTQSETAYDQAFLASVLGFPLVRGHDLFVRAGAVWMKVFGRTERVDVILRRVDTAYSDPLELRGDSQLGVAGLVECVRRGTVRVVNGLGSGVLENPALLPYLPAACEFLLDEPLRIPSVRTWWCGDPQARAFVLANLDSLSVRSIDEPLGTPRLTRPAPATLERRIAAEPHRYVGQELLPLSQAPSWTSHGVTSRPVVLRAFTLRSGTAYRPLVGGLASTYEAADEIDEIASSKDVWVLKSSPDDADQGLGEVVPDTPLAQAGAVTLPRVLQDMFWFGRYAERAEDVLRLVLVAQAMAEEQRTRPGPSSAVVTDAVMTALARLGGRWEDDLSREFRSLLLDSGRAGSAAQSLLALRDAGEGVRDQLSLDIWRAFGVIDRAAGALAARPHRHQVAESAGEMLTGILSLQGVTASMIHDPGWHMIGAGRALERAIQVAHLLRGTATLDRGRAVDQQVLAAALGATESAVTHRRRYRGQVTTRGVLDLLINDTSNPRAIAFSLHELRAHVAALPASTGATRPERLLEDLLAQLDDLAATDLSVCDGQVRVGLADFLDAVLAQLDRIGDALGELHFASGPRPRAFGAFSVAAVEPVAAAEPVAASGRVSAIDAATGAGG